MANNFGTKYDFAGKTINKLLVKEYIGKSRWRCICLACGKKTVKSSKDLANYRAYSCGCCNRNTDEDLSGKHFGKLIAQYRVKGEDGRTLWHCICTCGSGKTVDVRASRLLNGTAKSCGCLRHTNDADNLIGNTYNYLNVIAREPNDKNGRSMWRCKCLYNDCGNEIVVSCKSLLNGNTKSCGCLRYSEKYNDITDRRFGRLVAKYRLHGIEPSMWHCVCDCGNELNVLYSSLMNGKTKSCGCYRKDIVATKNHVESQKVRPQFPQWFIDDLAFDSDKERARRREIVSTEILSFVCPVHGIYNQIVNNRIRIHSGSHVYGCPLCSKNVAHRGSKDENEIKDYIESMGHKTEKAKKILDGKEIDILVVDKNIGIEYNGSVYHSCMGGVYGDKPVLYHQDKFLCAKEKGIHLISIFDVDWQNNQDRIKMYLRSLFSPQKELMARKLEIHKVDNNIACDFVDKYHIQGSNKAMMKINYGLYYNDELYAVMSFGKLRLSKTEEGQYELHRYCVKDGYKIVGGANKLLKHFERDYNPKYLLSYSDNDYFLGSIYSRLGFTYSGQSRPRYYWYLNGEERKRESCMLKRLKVECPDLLEEAYKSEAPNKEDYVMLSRGACKVYRSGNTKWEKFYNT